MTITKPEDSPRRVVYGFRC